MNKQYSYREQSIIAAHEKLKVLCKEMIETLRDEMRDRERPFKYRPFGPVNRAWTLDKWKERFNAAIHAISTD